jgi:hypothetical protein
MSMVSTPAKKSIIGPNLHLLCLREGLGIEIAGRRQEPDGPSFDHEALFPVLFISLRFQISKDGRERNQSGSSQI